MTQEREREIRQQQYAAMGCEKCQGKGVVAVRHAEIYTFDDVATAYHDEPCPKCSRNVPDLLTEIGSLRRKVGGLEALNAVQDLTLAEICNLVLPGQDHAISDAEVIAAVRKRLTTLPVQEVEKC